MIFPSLGGAARRAGCLMPIAETAFSNLPQATVK